MLYTVKSKKDLSELVEILEEEGLLLLVESPQQFSLNDPSEKHFDVFSNILSFFVAHINFRDQLNHQLLKKGLNKEQAIQLTEEATTDVKNSNYFFTLTRILVKEYLKKMQTFNIDSFSVFNMKGLKEEVKQFADDTYRMYTESPVENLSGIEEGLDISEAGMTDLFMTLRNRAIQNGLNLEDFKELHIYQEGDSLSFKNGQDLLIDDNFFFEYMGSSIQFEVFEKVDNPELFEGMMVSSVLINIFDVKKVVMHKTMTSKAKEMFQHNVTALKKETGKRIKVIDCNGCEHCN